MNVKPGPDFEPRKNRILLEVLLVFAISILFLWAWSATSPGKSLAEWQTRELRWNYFSHVFFVVLALLGVAIAGGNARSYGLNLNNLRFSLTWGVVFALVLDGTLLVAARFSGPLARPRNLLSTVVFQFLVVGFSEEFLYRGYIQSRLNQVFAKRFSYRGFSFGWGLLLTSILFGLAHLLNPFNPLAGRYSLDPVMAIISAVYGLYFGLMREKTGSILMPAIVHGANVMYYLFPVSTMGFGVAWLINGALLFRIVGPASLDNR